MEFVKNDLLEVLQKLKVVSPQITMGRSGIWAEGPTCAAHFPIAFGFTQPKTVPSKDFCKFISNIQSDNVSIEYSNKNGMEVLLIDGIGYKTQKAKMSLVAGYDFDFSEYLKKKIAWEAPASAWLDALYLANDVIQAKEQLYAYNLVHINPNYIESTTGKVGFQAGSDFLSGMKQTTDVYFDRMTLDAIQEFVPQGLAFHGEKFVCNTFQDGLLVCSYLTDFKYPKLNDMMNACFENGTPLTVGKETVADISRIAKSVPTGLITVQIVQKSGESTMTVRGTFTGSSYIEKLPVEYEGDPVSFELDFQEFAKKVSHAESIFVCKDSRMIGYAWEGYQYVQVARFIG